MRDITKIIDRVRKLLQLSEHAGNEHEAAQAAARAAQLMEEYQLSEALVRLDTPEAKPEAIVKDAKLEDDDGSVRTPGAHRRKRRVAWKESIATAVANSLGCKIWFQSGQIRCFGRESSVQTWNYTCMYLMREIDELCEKHWRIEGSDTDEGQRSARAWRNAFRVGAAQRVSEALWAQTAEQRKERKERARAVATDRRALALTVVDKDHEAVNDEYETFTKKFRTQRSIGRVTAQDGYRAGREAGARIKLGGGRGGLPAGQGRIGGGS